MKQWSTSEGTLLQLPQSRVSAESPALAPEILPTSARLTLLTACSWITYPTWHTRVRSKVRERLTPVLMYSAKPERHGGQASATPLRPPPSICKGQLLELRVVWGSRAAVMMEEVGQFFARRGGVDAGDGGAQPAGEPFAPCASCGLMLMLCQPDQVLSSSILCTSCHLAVSCQSL